MFAGGVDEQGGQVFVFVPCHMINDGGEVGGSVELNRLEALVVSFENPLDAVTVRVLNVAILWGEVGGRQIPGS